MCKLFSCLTFARWPQGAESFLVNYRQYILSPGVGQVPLVTHAFQSGAVQCTLVVGWASRTWTRFTAWWSTPCNSPWWFSLCEDYGLSTVDTLQGEGQSPVSFALMLSWEMMHCRVIRAVNHTQTLYLLVRTRSKDLYTADKLLVGPLVFVICYAVDRQHWW